MFNNFPSLLSVCPETSATLKRKLKELEKKKANFNIPIIIPKFSVLIKNYVGNSHDNYEIGVPRRVVVILNYFGEYCDNYAE